MTSQICLALDGLLPVAALNLVQKLGSRCYAVKIHDWLDREGPHIIRILKEHGAVRVWVDYKIHDTPDTVALRVGALVHNGADIVTVHASGGMEMMRKAVAAAAGAEIWAITVLTSLKPIEVARVYGHPSTSEVVLTLALMAADAGIHGLVCSAQEVSMLAQHPDLKEMKLVVPGTRSQGVALGQQARSGTPKQAVDDGATYLVAGGQVTKAADPVAAFEALVAEITATPQPA